MLSRDPNAGVRVEKPCEIAGGPGKEENHFGVDVISANPVSGVYEVLEAFGVIHIPGPTLDFIGEEIMAEARDVLRWEYEPGRECCQQRRLF